MESIAFGVPTITTDLSGFGQWVISKCEDGFAQSGVKVIHRTDSNYSDVVEQISTYLNEYLRSDDSIKKVAKNKAKCTAKKATWSNFIKYYEIAYNSIKTNNKNL